MSSEKKTEFITKECSFKFNKMAQERIGCRFRASIADRVTRVSQDDDYYQAILFCYCLAFQRNLRCTPRSRWGLLM